MPKWTIEIAWHDSANQGRVTVDADDFEKACEEAIRLSNAGEIDTRRHTYDPDPTYILAACVGEADPWQGELSIPHRFTRLAVAGGVEEERYRTAIDSLAGAMMALRDLAMGYPWKALELGWLPDTLRFGKANDFDIAGLDCAEFRAAAPDVFVDRRPSADEPRTQTIKRADVSELLAAIRAINKGYRDGHTIYDSPMISQMETLLGSYPEHLQEIIEAYAQSDPPTLPAVLTAAEARMTPLQKSIRDYAHNNLSRDGEVEIDSGAMLSVEADVDVFDNGGAYVMAWRWVDLEDVAKADSTE